MAKYRTLPSEIEKKVPEKLVDKTEEEIRRWASKALYNKGVEAKLTSNQIKGIIQGKIRKILLKPNGPFFFRQNIFTGEIQVVESIDIKLKVGDDFEKKLEFEENVFSPWLKDELNQISREKIKKLPEKEKIWIYYCHIKRCMEFLKENSDQITKSRIWERISRSGIQTWGKWRWFDQWYLMGWLPNLNKNSTELEWGLWTLNRLLRIKDIEVRNHWRKYLLDGTFRGIDLKKIWLVVQPYIKSGEFINEIRSRLAKQLISEDDLKSILAVYNAMNEKKIPRNQDIERLKKIIPERV